jgi:quinol monooxygenase YgiN
MQHRWSILTGAAMTALATFVSVPSAQAQTPTPQQYVVIYGELKPTPYAIQEGTRTLESLTRLAHQSAGVVHFASYAQIDRPNLFSLIEVWRDAASFTAFQSASNTQQVLGQLKTYLIAPLDERDGNLVQ